MSSLHFWPDLLIGISFLAISATLFYYVPKALSLIHSAKLSDLKQAELEALNNRLEKEIVERRHAEAELRCVTRELERRVEERTSELATANRELSEKGAIVQHSQDAIFSKRLDGTIVSWNPAAERIYGYSASEIIGRSVEVLIPKDRRFEFRQIMEKLRAGQLVPAFETRRVRKDGVVIDANVTISPIKDAAGAICGGSIIARDITEQKRSQQHMQQVQKLESLGLIAGGVAHDFNNLLVGILGNASLVLDSLTPQDKNYPSLETVVKTSEKAASLTQQLLAYAGKGRVVTEIVDFSDLTREITGLIQTSIPRTVSVRLYLAEGLPPIEADPGQLQQVIMNLVINGAEAIGENSGTLWVTTGVETIDPEYIRQNLPGDAIAPGKYVMLQVRDTGCGIEDPVRARIFDPFFTTKFTGRGLGLAAVLGIVRSHKGSIRVFSEPGRGSTFKVLLPAAPGKSQRAPAAEPPDDHMRGRGLILVVDDEQVVRTTAKAALTRYGYTVLTAADGSAGVEMFRRHASEVSAVLLDMTMPVMSGSEALKLIRSIRPDTRVVVSSGYNEVEAIRRFTSAGVAAFIQKPYTAAKLARLIKSVIETDAADRMAS